MNTWDEITQRLSKQIPKQSFETWFKPTQLFQENEDEIMVSVPSNFSKEWIEKHYLDIIKELLSTMDSKKKPFFLCE